MRETWPTLSDRQVLEYLARASGLIATSQGERDALAGEFVPAGESWLRLDGLVRRASGPRTNVAVVGGGIAGLYCAYELAKRRGFEVSVYEAAARFGGRIETAQLGPFAAEFGPMRFEPKVQKLLASLVDELNEPRPCIRFKDFTPMKSEPAAALTASDRYNLRHGELRHTWDVLDGDGDQGKPDPTRPLDLLRLGLLRMFR